MANKILLAGKSGSGKTYSLRTLNPKSTFIICPDEKNPPFEGWRKNYIMQDKDENFNPATCNYYKVTDWDKIRNVLKFISENRPEIKVAVIDTITYAMIGEFMQKAKMTGYGKFTEMGLNVYETLKMIDGLRNDLTVIVCAHTDYEEENGVGMSVFAVPGGKLVKDVVKPVGMFLITLETKVKKVGENVEYKFMVSNNTTNMAKVPAGIFNTSEVDNDMNFVLESIRKYEFGE
jgi:hypothetical protein